jgi:hypothetical protein
MLLDDAVLVSRARVCVCMYVFLFIIFLFFNNHPDAPIIQIYSVIKLYMFRASSLPIIRSFLLCGRKLLMICYDARSHECKVCIMYVGMYVCNVCMYYVCVYLSCMYVCM